MKSALLIILLGISVVSCQSHFNETESQLAVIVKEVQEKYAPDKREAVFDVKIVEQNNQIILEGETDSKEALEELAAKISDYKVLNKVLVLPDNTLEGKYFAVVNNSTANIRSDPRHSAELATQALLGHVVKLLKKNGGWYLVQTADKYISWVDGGGIFPLESPDQWVNTERIIYTEAFGYVYKDKGKGSVVSDIVLACQLRLVSEDESWYEVAYPDGRSGFVDKSDAMPYQIWLESLKPSGENIIDQAKRMVGIPYLWGGTSVKGVDCSGFTKTAYLMNGIVIPRDASLQALSGVVVDPKLKFEGLQAGDLMFFGKAATDSTSQKVTHVALWIGEGQFIHSSRNVRINSVNPDDENYDEYNTNRYLGSRRYLKNLKGNLVDLRTTVYEVMRK